MNWQDFRVDSIQAAMFTADRSAFVPSRVVTTTLRRFGDQFSGEMQVLPIPSVAPPQLPRVVLNSNDGSRGINTSLTQFTCFWKRRDAAAQVTLDQTARQCVDVLEHYVRETGVSIGRLGLVIQRVCANETPAMTLIQRFCNERSQVEPFNRSATFEIFNHKTYRPIRDNVDYMINSSVRCQTGVLDLEKTAAVVVTQDLNTIATDLDQRRFDAERVSIFFSMASDEAETIMRKYFPE